MKWAAGKVAVSLAESPADEGKPPMFAIVIEDDGPGIPEDKAREALKRGRRLDETKPGTGLGLAIVAELVNEYGGRLDARALGARRAEGGGRTARRRHRSNAVTLAGPNFGQI